MRIAGIYRIVLLTDGRCYVGQSVDVRFRLKRHRYRLRRGDHQCKLLQLAWNEHGEDAFHFHLLEECGRETLTTRERYWLRRYGSAAFNQIAPGRGATGWRHTPEARAKIGAAFKGRTFSPEHLARLSDAGKARVGIKLSEQHRANIGAAHKGLRRSEETRARMRVAQQARRAREKADAAGGSDTSQPPAERGALPKLPGPNGQPPMS